MRPKTISGAFVLGIIIFLALACNRNLPYVNKDFAQPADHEQAPEPAFTLFFTGNFDERSDGDSTMKLLKRLIADQKAKTTTVLLGNYVYPRGLPDEEDANYDKKARGLETLLRTFKGNNNDLIFLPGNRDWDNGGDDGPEKLLHLELFIEQFFDQANVFIPGDGCPGPVEIELTGDVTLIAFDSQWWLHNNSKYSGDFDCDFDDLETEADYRNEILMMIRDALERNKDKKVIFATHHPIWSAGRHGGHFPPEESLFPLLALKKYLWIPLPGFLYTAARKFFGTPQDIAHPDYFEMRRSLQKLFKNYPGLIYLSSHDHNLQYVSREGLHHIVSGAATSADYVAKNINTDFAMQSKGFGKLDFFDDGDVWLEFIVSDGKKNKGRSVFKTKLYNKKTKPEKIVRQITAPPDYTDSTVIKKASGQYDAGKLRRFLKGDSYRADWSIPVEFPVFDISKEHGGLKIVKRGGGQQTKSVRLEAADERQWVLRSIEKYVEGALPDEFHGTIAVEIVQDGIAQSNPYAALVVPRLADAAGVYHTNPQIVFVPDDPRLGIYRKEMANRLYLYEERPDGDRRDVASFGRSGEITSTSKVLKKLENKHDHLVDQQSVLSARLLDMVIADWDRHEDQWRWAAFDVDDKTIYKPIPRDRDNVFFVAEGPMNWLTKRKWLQPKFQGFDHNTKHIAEFNKNARHFDRSFLHMTTREQWKNAAVEMQNSLTNQVIEDAVAEGLPEKVFNISGEEIIGKLKSRRDRLPQFADDYYTFLAKKVDIPGTDDRDLFIVERLNDNETKVTARELSQKKGKIKDIFYQRIFKTDETREIRIYGRKDKDKFIVKGTVDKGIKVRIIGGKGHDTIIDQSHVKGLGRKTIVYDKKSKSNVVIKGRETKDLRSNRKGINKYDRELFKYNLVLPLAYMGYSPDDGVFIGGGAYIKNYHFRDSTFHRILGNYAYETGAFNIRYNLLASSFIRSLDLLVDAEISAPNVVSNFYGLGNETVNEAAGEGKSAREYYRVRYHFGSFRPQLRKTITPRLKFLFGISAVYGKVERTRGRFIDDLEINGLSEDIFLDQYLAGITAAINYDTRDDEDFPSRGMLLHLAARRMFGLNGYSGNFTGLSGDLSMYLSFRKDPRIVLALRFGGGQNLGDYPFYMARGLGDKTSLRGFRANRFTGDASAYQNTELRLKLLRLNTYLLNGNLGLLGFNDVGRVWYDDEDSGKWHHGYGFGLWMTPYNVLTMSVNMNFSSEEKYLSLRLSYLF